LSTGDDVRLQLDVVTATDVADPRQAAVARNGAQIVRITGSIRQWNERPILDFILSVDRATHEETERQFVTFREAQLTERNPDLHGPALIRYLGFAGEYSIPAVRVQRHGFVGDQGIVLGAQRIHLEQEGIPTVQKGVNADVCVVILVIAPTTLHVLGANQVGILIREVEREVQVVAIVRHLDPGVFGRISSFIGPALDEIVHWGDVLPNGVVDATINTGSNINENGFHLRWNEHVGLSLGRKWQQ